MKIKKIIASIVLAAILTANIISCGGGDKSNENTTTTTASSQNSGDETATDDTQTPEETTQQVGSVEARPDYPELPVKDLEGYNFRVISRSEKANDHWYNIDIATEAEDGDTINDAVYLRNKNVEEKYNITITNIPSDNVGTAVKKSVKAGSNDYDLAVIGLNGGMESLMPEGNLLDLKQVPFVDLTKPWWDQKAVEQLSLDNKLFATTSDLTIRDKDATIIFMFSKKLAQDYEVENLYELVKNGKWTFDKLYEYAKKASKDLNSDGVINDLDQMGLLTQIRHGGYLWNGAGEQTITLDSDKMPVLSLYSDRSIAITEKIREIQADKNIAINADEGGGRLKGSYDDVWNDMQIPMFAENRALFLHAGMNRVSLLRSMDTDFGIIPPPKYDENQAEYSVAVDAWCTSAVGIPTTVVNPETIGLILEAVTYESRYTLLPAYYDTQLKTKMARDEDSKAMIDLILAHRSFDIGDVYRWGSITGAFEDIAQGKATTLTTFYEKNQAKIETAMQKTIDKYESLE